METRAEEWRLTLCLSILCLVLFGSEGLRRYSPLGYLIGDGPYYAQTSVSLLYDGDLDLRNQLLGGLAVHGPQIALGLDGAWYPKHPILLPVLALPFLWLFGVPGFLVCNLFVLAGLAAAMLRLARQHAPPPASVAAVLALLLGTFLRSYAYNFSADLLATLFLTLGVLALQKSRPAWGGFLLGVAVLGKILLVLALPLALTFAAVRSGWRGVLRLAAGSALPLGLMACLNATLFGSPFVTSYDRNVLLQDGALVVTSHRGQFHGDPLSGLVREFLDPRHGLLPTAPVLLLAIPGTVLLARRRLSEALFSLGIAASLIAFLATYRHWDTSHYGNRFLMPVIALSAPAVALALEHGWAAARAWVRPARSAARSSV
jgi:hypothetical protein